MGITDAFENLLQVGMSCCMGWLVLAIVVAIVLVLRRLNEEEKEQPEVTE